MVLRSSALLEANAIWTTFRLRRPALVYATGLSTNRSRITLKITGLPPATLISDSARTATPVHFFVIRLFAG